MKISAAAVWLFFCQCILLNATAKTPDVYVVSYSDLQNGEVGNSTSVQLRYADGLTALDAASDQIQSFTNFTISQNLDFITYQGEVYKLVTSFDSLPKPAFTSQHDKILGFDCAHAAFSSFSNKIEVWYTTAAKAKGSPYKNYLPNHDALVLKVLINGTYGLVATDIKKDKKAALPAYPSNEAKQITSAEFEELKIKSRYTVVPVFENEVVNFEGDLAVPQGKLKGEKTYRFSKGTVILKKIALPAMGKDGAFVYANLTCSSLGDAYDRTGSVFMLPVNSNHKTMLQALQLGLEQLPIVKDNLGNEYQGFTSDDSYDVPIELMRFFTSFGVNHFNNRRPINNYNWANAAVYKQDISALIPENQDSVWIGVFIGNYSKDGHQVSLELDFYPGYGKEEGVEKWVEPLFLTVNLMEMSGQSYPSLFANDSLEVAFNVPENATELQLLFTTTGHGGWGGGDEFNQKINEIFVDEKMVYSVVPWRTDCATYRLSNPASGNFGNGISSSDLSRSNWCPATVTPPYVVPLKNLSPGRHILKVAIPQGAAEGGSFSHWGLSGILIGNLKK